MPILRAAKISNTKITVYQDSFKKVVNISKYLIGNIFETLKILCHNAKNTGAFSKHGNLTKMFKKTW